MTGPTSWKDLATVNGIHYESWREVAEALNLIGSEEECERILEEAAAVQKPPQLRMLFAHMLLAMPVKDPTTLWETFKEHLSEDYHRTLHDQEAAHMQALADIRTILERNGLSLEKCKLPEVARASFANYKF